MTSFHIERTNSLTNSTNQSAMEFQIYGIEMRASAHRRNIRAHKIHPFKYNLARIRFSNLARCYHLAF